MKHFFSLSGFLLLFILGPVRTVAQTEIRGIVSDNVNGIALAGARIEIPGTTTETESEPDGTFSLNIREKLPIKIAVTHGGYELKEINIIAATDNLLVSMVPGALVGQELLVTGTRRQEKVQEAPSSIDYIEQEELLQDAVMNPFLSLRTKMGLDVVQAGVNSGNITLRGRSDIFNSESFAMLDYRNLILPGLGILYYSQQPIDPIDLDRIEVVKGPGSALYVPGLEAGIVHFLSISPFDKQGTSVSVGAGTRNTFLASLRHAGTWDNGRFGYKLTAHYRRARDWEIDSTDAVEAQHLAGFQPQIRSSLTGNLITDNIPDYNVESMGLTGTLAYRPNANTTLTAVGGWAVGKGIFRTAQGEGYTKAPRPFGQLRVQTGGFFGQVFYSYQDGRDGNSYLYTTGLTNITESHQVEGQMQYSLPIKKEGTSLVLGMDYRLNSIDSKKTVHGRWEDDDNYTVAGVYGQSEIRINPRFDLVAAARVDHFVPLKSSFFSPRLALVFKPSPKHTVRATFNRAFGAPTALNLFADLPLANQGAFAAYLLGGVDEVSFNHPQTSSFLPGVGASDGIGLDLQPLYGLITGILQQQQALPQSVIDYLGAQTGLVNGFSNGVLSQLPLNRPKLKLSSSHVYEIGYKGLVEDKLSIAVDLYYNRRKNVVSAPFQASPLVFQPTLASDLAGALEQQLNRDELEQMGLTPEAVATIYASVAEGIAFNGETGQPNPLGLIESDQSPAYFPIPTLDFAYYNIKSIDYWGLDIGTRYFFPGNWSAYANLSWLSQNLFEDVPVGEGESSSTTDFSLNVPATKIKVGVELDQEFGWNGFIGLRYQSKWQSINGALWTGPVDAFVMTDLGVGYAFRNKVSVSATMTNALKENYRAFYGAPKIGRQLIAKMYYDF